MPAVVKRLLFLKHCMLEKGGNYSTRNAFKLITVSLFLSMGARIWILKNNSKSTFGIFTDWERFLMSFRLDICFEKWWLNSNNINHSTVQNAAKCERNEQNDNKYNTFYICRKREILKRRKYWSKSGVARRKIVFHCVYHRVVKMNLIFLVL